MDFVIDSNILFAVLIKDSITAEIILNEKFNLFAPKFIFREFLKYKKEILEKTKRSSEEFNEIFRYLQESITIIPKEEFERFLDEAEKITPDHNDVEYIALALKLNIPVWSNDKKLKNQNKIKIISTEEIIKLIKK